MSQILSSTSCFDGLIGLKGSCEAIDGLLINELGIDKTFIGQVITKDYLDEKDFFIRKRDFAIRSVANQIHNHLRPKYKSATVLNNYRVGHYADNYNLIAGSGKLKGLEIDICQSDSYLDLFINEINLHIDQTTTVSILVYDLKQNKLLDTIDIDTTANEISKLYVNKTYKSDKKHGNFFIGYDSTGISANTARLKKDCRQCSGGYYSQVKNSYEVIRAAEIDSSDNKIKSNLDYLTETGGLSIVHSLSCNHSDWLCSISNQLSLPVLYKTAEMIYDHALSAAREHRANTSTGINNELLKERFDKMNFLYSEAMNNLLQNIRPPEDEICFACKENLRHAIMI